jgi:ABC-type multidrug transport system fused ATPase/permease subunit
LHAPSLGSFYNTPADMIVNSIDHDIERDVEGLLASRLPGTTVVSVLHRLETATQYDKIIVLDQGKLLGIGTPADIIAQCDLLASLRT